MEESKFFSISSNVISLAAAFCDSGVAPARTDPATNTATAISFIFIALLLWVILRGWKT